MAKTQGHGNPDWSRDEVILALDLYLSCGGSIPSGSDPRVQALSETLRRLTIHPLANRVGSFRNPDGVSFKLQNIRQVASGKGLANVSRVDREVWAAFGEKPEEVKALAAAILSLASADKEAQFTAGDDEEVFPEGGVLTAYHRRLERSPDLRKALLAKRSRAGSLCCDGCGWMPMVSDERLAQAAFEAHRLQPLAKVGKSGTKLSEVALLCANCHRLVHRWIAISGEWLAIDKIKLLVLGSKAT